MITYHILGPKDPTMAALATTLASHPELKTELVILP